jgi:hypothetical protein
VAPALTQLPTSLSQTVQLTGTYTGYVNQSTGAALAAPQQIPVSVTRTVKAVPGDSTSSVLVVNDSSAVTIGPAKSESVSQYTLDRTTSKSVASPHAYALSPANVVNRTGTYSLGTPPGADTSKSYPLYTDDIGRAAPLSYAHSTTTVDGLSVQEWQQNVPPTPVSPAIVKAMKLAPSMPFAAFAAEAKAQGLNLAGAFTALMPSLTPAQRASVASVAAAPIPLQYLYATQSKLLVEPSTGTTVDIASGVQSYSVKPDLSHLAAVLTPILEAHASNPVAAKLIASASKLTSVQAQPLYTINTRQTPASVASLVSTTKNNASLLQLVQLWVPIALIVIGIILAGLSFLIRRRRPKTEDSAPSPGSAGTATSSV